MANKRPFINKINNLDPKQWIKFQKSWFVHNPPPRKKDVIRHPAKFPETLAQEFVEFFTKKGDTVLDPMAGTGSTTIACLRSGRHSIGIELNPKYAEIARNLIEQEKEELGEGTADLRAEIVTANAALSTGLDLPLIDYIFTSPPYWDMLHARGAGTQKKRRASPKLDVFYSDDPADLGNIEDYEVFLERLVEVYRGLIPSLQPRAYITIIVKNLKKGGRIYPLAWDLAQHLSSYLTLKDERIWVQDNIPLAPYGMGNAWVSNIHHHYCLQFRYEP